MLELFFLFPDMDCSLQVICVENRLLSRNLANAIFGSLEDIICKLIRPAPSPPQSPAFPDARHQPDTIRSAGSPILPPNLSRPSQPLCPIVDSAFRPSVQTSIRRAYENATSITYVHEEPIKSVRSEEQTFPNCLWSI